MPTRRFIPIFYFLLIAILLLPANGRELVGIQSLKILINGTPVQDQSASLSTEERAMVPMGSPFQHLGASVNWQGQTRTAISSSPDNILQLRAENAIAQRNAQNPTRDNSAFVTGRLLSLAMGSVIHWDGENQTVLISNSADNWPISTPESQGMNSRILNQMFQSVDAYQGHDIHSILILRHGQLVAEKYYRGYTAETPQPIWSVTKSILSAVTGIALEQGAIPSLDEKVLTYFPDIAPQDQDPRKRNITLRHLLTMTSGFAWKETNPLPQATAFLSPETSRYLLNRPLAHQPGETFNYDSGNAHLLSVILQRQTGKTTFSYARDILFNPLNITEIRWGTDGQGYTYGGYGIEMRPRDMAKFGQLYLQEGLWQGRRLVPANWISESTQGYIGAEGRNTLYGYLWRIESNGTYRADGGFGQRILVDPAHDVVVVFTSGNTIYDFNYYDQLYQDYILKSMTS